MTNAAFPATERSITAILSEDFGITHRGPGTAHELFDRDGKSMGFYSARGACELIERLRSEAKATNAKVHAAGVAAALAVPDRIVRAIYSGHVIPPADKTLVEMLSDCSRLLKAQEAKGRSGHWSFDANRLRALRQAESAMLAMLAEDDTVVSGQREAA